MLDFLKAGRLIASNAWRTAGGYWMASFAVALDDGRTLTHTLPPPCRSKHEMELWLANISGEIGSPIATTWQDFTTPGGE